MKKFPSFLISVLFQISCSAPEQLLSVHVHRFYQHQSAFEEVIILLNEDPAAKEEYGSLINTEEFTPLTREKLEQLGIEQVHIFSWGRRIQQYHFIAKWQKNDSIHLYHNSLDSIPTQDGYYHIDEYKNETRGLGNYWAISVVRRYVTAKQ
jgi:hypothetical protein